MKNTEIHIIRSRLILKGYTSVKNEICLKGIKGYTVPIHIYIVNYYI